MLPVNTPTRPNVHHLRFRCFCGSDETFDISEFNSMCVIGCMSVEKRKRRHGFQFRFSDVSK